MPFCDLNDDIKPWLKIETTDTTHDSILTIIRDAVEESVIQYTENNFESNVEVNEILDGNKSDAITPRNSPIISVQQILFNVNTDGTDGSLIDPENYLVLPEGITLRNILTPNARSSVRVDYTWGYAALPPDVKLAILLGVEAEFRRKGRKSIGAGARSKKDESESSSSGTSAWDKKTGLPKEVVFKLNPYRVFEFPTQPMATRNR